MLIALDCRSVYPGMGGIGTFTENMTRSLLQVDGHNEYLLLYTHRALEAGLQPPERTQAIFYRTGMIDETWEQLVLPSELERLGADVYLGPTFTVPVASRTLRRAAVVHDVVFLRLPHLVAPPLRRYLERSTRLSCEFADLLLTVSEFSRAEICQCCQVDASRVRVLRQGVSPEFENVADVEENPRQRQILYVGALEPKKNVGRLLEAFKLFLSGRAAPPHRLLLVGPQGSMAIDVDGLVRRLGLGERVDVLGYVDRPTLLSLYRSSEMFVYPSLYEGFGLPPLEAMACGTPVIASNSSSLPEVVGGAGLLIDPLDVPALADAMARLAADPGERKRLGELGRQRARQFSWGRSAEELLGWLTELCEKTP